jgi:hypothetical protein
MWGLGGLFGLSYRTFIAQFAEQNHGQPTTSVQEVATRFAEFFWREYTTRQAPQITRLQLLLTNSTINEAEQRERDGLLNNLSGGFCVGGNLAHDRTPVAVEILYDPCSRSDDEGAFVR